jgi:hypothetical protein
MTKYIANPIAVDARVIVEVGEPAADGDRNVVLDDGSIVIATAEMTARMTPHKGDFWVVQSDGYAYLNSREVFLRKYHKAI